MWELVKAGGWLMLPLLLCSIFMLAISLERLIRLKRKSILPPQLMLQGDDNTQTVMDALHQDADLQDSTLGRIFMAGERSRLQSLNMHGRKWKRWPQKKLAIWKKTLIF